MRKAQKHISQDQVKTKLLYCVEGLVIVINHVIFTGVYLKR